MLANGAEAGCDPLVITPGLERIAPELLALVADNVFRGGTGGINGASRKRETDTVVGLFLNIAKP